MKNKKARVEPEQVAWANMVLIYADADRKAGKTISPEDKQSIKKAVAIMAPDKGAGYAR